MKTLLNIKDKLSFFFLITLFLSVACCCTMDPSYCFLALFLSFLLTLKLLFRSRRSLPPTPLPLPIIGHLHLLKEPLHKSLGTLSSQYGPIFRLRFGVHSVLVVSSASIVEECFTKNDVVFANRPRTLVGDTMTYNYTTISFAPYGHLWRTLRRRTVVEIFSTNSLRKYSSIREEEVCSLVRELFRGAKNESQKVDLKFLFSLLAFNSMMRTVVGRKCIEMGETVGMEEAKQRLKELKGNFVPNASMNVCDCVPALRWVGYKGIERNMVKLHRKRDEFLQRFLDEFRRNRITGPFFSADSEIKREASVVETLLALQESEPEFYTDTIIKSIILVMFIAGTDTASITLERAMSLLLNHPEAFKKVRSEIDNCVKRGRLINDMDLSNLPYLRCVVYEALRLFPPVPLLLPHFSSDNCTIGGYEIPQQTTLLVNAWAIHRDPNVRDEPTMFKPERFKGVEGEREGFRFIPFGAGRRACPGAGMGLRTVSLGLGAMIQCFEWGKVEEGMDMTCAFGLTMSKASPLQALCSPRRDMVELLASH